MPEGPKHFSEVAEALECIPCLKIVLYDFYKTNGVAGVHVYFSEVVEDSECLGSSYIFLYDF